MEKCIICLDDIEQIPILLCCRQNFHLDCAWFYLSKTDKCAICKNSFSNEIYKEFQNISKSVERIAYLTNKKFYVYTCDCPPIIPCTCAYRTYDNLR